MNRCIRLLYYGFMDKNWHRNVSTYNDINFTIYFYNLIDSEVVMPEIRLINGTWIL